MIRYSEEMKPEDMQHMFSRSRLIRTEISTLIGLLLKSGIDYSLPTPDVFENYVDTTEMLLEEMHRAMSGEFFAILDPDNAQDPDFNPFTIGSVLREPIFYGGESAYSFQYRDLSLKKYSRDNDWLITHRGLSVQDARDVVYAIGRLLDQKAAATMKAMREVDPAQWTILPGYTFTSDEVSAFSAVDIATVQKALAAFSLPKDERNARFNALHDFNIANALPLISADQDSYILFHIYSLVEALYESPFYWMAADAAYSNTSLRHRGLFTEEFSAECMARVFEGCDVHSNVDIYESRKKVGEIDVLVIFGDRAIVLQAKSKRLTLEARKGNVQQIKDDFKKTVQDSCDQAYRCADMLQDSKYVLKDTNAERMVVETLLKEIYILCVISDHYPALSFQARQFLHVDARAGISPPFVLDVFTLDAMTEMLESPLKLLSYIDRRTKYSEKLLATHELTILSYHLRQNLWLSDEHDLVS